MSSSTIALHGKPLLFATTTPMKILGIRTLDPCNRIIVERAVFFSTLPAPTPSTARILMEPLGIKSTCKNIGTGIIL
jgi:hypothetical protein